MYFSSRVDISQKLGRRDWDGIFFVINVSQVQIRIHVVGKCLVADTRETVAVRLERCSRGQPKGEIHRIEKGDSPTYTNTNVYRRKLPPPTMPKILTQRVADHGYRCCAVF